MCAALSFVLFGFVFLLPIDVAQIYVAQERCFVRGEQKKKVKPRRNKISSKKQNKTIRNLKQEAHSENKPIHSNC